MTSETYVPKHRKPGAHKRRRARPGRVALLTGAALTATGLAVTTGVLADPGGGPLRVAEGASGSDSDSHRAAARIAGDRVAGRTAAVTRSDRRGAKDPVKAAELSTDAGPALTRTQEITEEDPRGLALALLPEYGFSHDQFGCLDLLYVSESNWRVDADNPTSSAYGIPQALTATHDLPEGYLTSAEVQIRWGLQYIANRYGTPCRAWTFKLTHNWY